MLTVLATAAGAQAPGTPPGPPATTRPAEGGRLGFGALGRSKEPITVVSDGLEYDYKRNVVVYRGKVQVNQGNVQLVSDALTITLDDKSQKRDGAAAAGPTPSDTGRVREIVASGNVRIDQGVRWAVGGRAVFDQGTRTLILTENPVLHDGPSEVAGDRVVVFLDEDRSVVEGGKKRVKAILYPDDKAPPPKPGASGAVARPGR